MDRIVADRITKELKGKEVGGWLIVDYVNHGKSALVFRACKDGREGALKVFDPELLERFGSDVQLARIEREKSLIGKNHPHLVEILDGGTCGNTNYVYVAMTYLPMNNLAQVLEHIPGDQIFPIIAQVASAAKFLEDNNLVHRDIKPENIAISQDFQTAILLDLGVIRPIGLSNLTDEEGQHVFVGTLQYSPPEFLVREEMDGLEGWRAVTFYQLGAVLHDLIMRRPLFADEQPYARMVRAVAEAHPTIEAEDVDENLIVLARSCLLKDPEVRLKLLSWTRFLSPFPKASTVDQIRQAIRQMQVVSKNMELRQRIVPAGDHEHEHRSWIESMLRHMEQILRKTCVDDEECFPPLELHSSIDTSKHTALLSLSFRPSTRQVLENAVTFLISISVVDFDERVVLVQILAMIGPECFGPGNFDSTRAETLFEGVYNEQIISTRLRHIMYSLIHKSIKYQVEIGSIGSEMSAAASPRYFLVMPDFEK